MVILIILITSTASADVNHEAFLGSHIRALRSSSANALTDDSIAGPVFGYAYRLPLDTTPKLELWGTGMFTLGFVDGQMFQTLTTHTTSLQMSAGVRARYSLFRQFVVANARLDLGAQRATVSLEDMEGHDARDAGWGAVSTAALGLEINPLSLRSVSVGFRAELGYVAAQGIGLTAKSKGAPEDTIELDRMAASIGHLDIGGRYFSFTLQARF
ncbi:MAG: hypothetical protein M4D80_32565 [Myxococcota bacterium]|nr:hypothetical protein [Myxococcota bacterium]